MTRTLVLWLPDWPMTARGIAPDRPAAVVETNRVTVTTRAAREAGVRAGLRRREAQARCPDLEVLERDEDGDARAFSPVVGAVVAAVPATEVVRPGLLALAVRGPARALGGERAVADHLAAAVAGHLAATVAGHLAATVAGHLAAAVADALVTDEVADATSPAVADPLADPLADPRTACRIGIADGRFAAVLAARHATADAPVRCLEPGEDAAFLAGLPITVLAHDPALVAGAGGPVAPTLPGLAPARGGPRSRAGARRRTASRSETLEGLLELLRRLGIATLGDLTALPERAVADRFGALGLRAHRLARGRDDHRLVAVEHVPDRVLRIALDPPAAQVDPVAFAVRGPVEQLLDGLAAQRLTCTLVAVEVVTEHDERCVRRWRSHDGFTAARLVDRVRWQLDGWLTGAAGDPRPTAAVAAVRITPEELVDGGRQVSLLDAATAPTPAVVRALTRVQGMLGPGAVLVAVPAGGRDPAAWVRLVPWDPEGPGPDPGPGPGAGPHRGGPTHGDPDHRRGHASDAAAPTWSGTSGRPWPGRLPAPAPATVLTVPAPAEVVDAAGAPVAVSGRGVVSAAPHRVRVGSGPWRDVLGWAGPWPADERWWEPDGRRRARFQLAVDGAPAVLLALEGGRWAAEAVYD